MHFFNRDGSRDLAKGLTPVVTRFTSFMYLCELVSAGLPELNIQDANSIKGVAGQVAHDLMGFYNGNQSGQTPGLLPQPYYQWEAGGMLLTMIDYFYYTGDATYNDLVTQGMLWQAGPENDFMDANQSHVEGNDDQVFWGFAALSAAEQGFPNPPAGSPSWIQLAENLFNDQVSRWDMSSCNGGLRWQIFSYMTNGYDYKSTIANGGLFNVAARLALYTGNDTYAQWAEKIYDWTVDVGYITPDYAFYDGAHTERNCSDTTKMQWSYNLGVFLHGAATMYSYRGSSDMWKQRVAGIVNASSVFVLNDVVYESSCEPYNNCNASNFSFKSYLIRWLAATTKLASFTRDQIMPILQATAKAAAAQCTGGDSGTMCGMKWTNNGQWDGTQGVEQQMGVLEAVTAPLIDSCPSIDSKKVSPSSPPSGGHPDSTGLPESSPSTSAAAAQPPVASVALPCSTCSGGSTIISAPSSVMSAFQSLATVSSAAAAAPPPSSQPTPPAGSTTGSPPSNLTIMSSTQSMPAAAATASNGVPGSIPSPPPPSPSSPGGSLTSSTVIVGGSTAVVAAIDTPTGSAGAIATGTPTPISKGGAASPESVFTGGAAAGGGIKGGMVGMVRMVVFWMAVVLA